LKAQFLAAAAALLLTSCGYIGDPLPPLANVPPKVQDLAAIQRGSVIISHLSIPQLTTESKPIPRPLTFDLRIGPNEGEHFDENEWASHARHIVTPEITGPIATYEIPIREWIGKEVILGVRITAANGKSSGWSNFVIVPVIPAPAKPEGVTPAETAQGVHLTWRAEGKSFRVLRKSEGSEYAVAATVESPEWTDTSAEFGKPYTYMVQTLAHLDNKKEAESDLSAEVSITPVDKFAPAVPAGVHANAAPASIELAWDRNAESDLAGYRVYRATGEGAFDKVAELTPIPTWSDHAVEPGKTYRYALSAFDRVGNESERSPAVQITFPGR
jgi:hypothetical protein